MKIDMHCHVREGSVDSRVSLDEYITTLKEKGFDVDVHAITVEEAKQSILQVFGMKVKKNGSEENV